MTIEQVVTSFPKAVCMGAPPPRVSLHVVETACSPHKPFLVQCLRFCHDQLLKVPYRVLQDDLQVRGNSKEILENAPDGNSFGSFHGPEE